MAIAYAVEERNCIQAEVDLASRRCRQLVFAAHNQALLADKLNAKLDTVEHNISLSVQDVLENPETPYDGTHVRCLGTEGKFGLSHSLPTLMRLS